MPKIKKPTSADISAVLSDNVAMRKIRNQVVFSTLTYPRNTMSDKRLNAIDRFKEANSWAKAILKTPGMKELYAKGINDKLSNAHTVAVSDYLHAPKIHYVNVKKYTGAVGDEIRIKATDDFQVTAVEISITSGNGEVVEKGPAIRYARKPAIWVYAVTVTNPDVNGTIIKVTAMDRPENEAEHVIKIGEIAVGF